MRLSFLLLALTVVLARPLPARADPPEGEPATSDQPQGPSSQPKKKKKKPETVFGVMAVTEEELAGEEPSPARDNVLAFVTPTVKTISELPASERDKATKSALDRFNIVAGAIEPKGEPADTIRLINNAASYLNTSAGRPDKGLEFAQKAVMYDPSDRDAYINRSLANYGLSRLDEAFQDADRAAKLDPSSAEAFRARSMASYGRKDYLQAIEDARRALALDPSDKTAFAIMKLSESRVPAMDINAIRSRLAVDILRDYHGMVQQMSQVDKRRQEPLPSPLPQPSQRLIKAAASKITLKDYPAAIADADKALAFDPNNAGAYYYRAAAQNLLGRYQEAADDATRALVITPSDFVIRDARAWALNHLGRFRDAIADSNHSLEVNPRNPYAYANRGYSYEHMGDLDTMLRDLKKAASLSTDFEPAYRDAAARHGLNPEAAGRGPTEAEVAAARERARRRSFLTVLVSSSVGGLLIAAGFLHLTSFQKVRPAKGARTVTAPGMNFGGLEAGYTLGRQLGIGGMGVVYEAVDKALQRKVAVKVLRQELASNAADRERFLEEARTVAALHHPGIVDIHSIVEDACGVYLVFEYVEGKSLHQVISESGRLSLSEAQMILKQICQALDYAHRRGIVHRDLKPGNIMVTGAGQVKVMDFGISRHALDAAGPLSTSEKATVCGTPDYMAPEQEQGLIRRESDVFSLGCLLYEMTTGRRVYPGGSEKVKLARSYPKASELVPSLPADIDRIIDWALHPEPAERVRSARDFWALLGHVRDGGAVAA